MRPYPKLIDEEELIAANEKRSNKPQLPKKTEAAKGAAQALRYTAI